MGTETDALLSSARLQQLPWFGPHWSGDADSCFFFHIYSPCGMPGCVLWTGLGSCVLTYSLHGKRAIAPPSRLSRGRRVACCLSFRCLFSFSLLGFPTFTTWLDSPVHVDRK